MQRLRAWWSVILPVAAIAALAFSLHTPRGKAQALPDAAEAIQKARVSTHILYITAHPDDEASPLLVYLARGLGADVSLLTVTSGQGGQNAIGPEQGTELGMLRTSELLSASEPTKGWTRQMHQRDFSDANATSGGHGRGCQGGLKHRCRFLIALPVHGEAVQSKERRAPSE